MDVLKFPRSPAIKKNNVHYLTLLFPYVFALMISTYIFKSYYSVEHNSGKFLFTTHFMDFSDLPHKTQVQNYIEAQIPRSFVRFSPGLYQMSPEKIIKLKTERNSDCARKVTLD